DVELGAIHCAHPAGFPCVTLPLHRGPIYCASCAAKTKQTSALKIYYGISFFRIAKGRSSLLTLD
ncbi:MAG: hypothetical protein ABI866_11840, partial [Dokdonella sp.]